MGAGQEFDMDKARGGGQGWQGAAEGRWWDMPGFCRQMDASGSSRLACERLLPPTHLWRLPPGRRGVGAAGPPVQEPPARRAHAVRGRAHGRGLSAGRDASLPLRPATKPSDTNPPASLPTWLPPPWAPLSHSQMEALVACFVELAATQFPQKPGGGAPADGWAFPASIKRRLQVGGRGPAAARSRCPCLSSPRLAWSPSASTHSSLPPCVPFVRA
jgi:hypothetical protein